MIRTIFRGACAAVAALALASPVAAQNGAVCQPRDDGREPQAAAGQPRAEYQAFDVIVDVADLCVDRIQLRVEGLDAHLSLNSQVANLVRVQAGADVSIQTVDLGIHGVRAEALLLVDLDNIVYVVDRTLTFLDRSPEVVERLMGTVQNTVGTVGGVANQALRPGGPLTGLVDAVGRTLDQVTRPGGLLTRTVNQAGETVARTLAQGGAIVEHTANAAGTITNSRTVGNLLDLSVVEETTNAAGQTVRRVRDQSGALLEYTLDQAGQLAGARVLQQGSGR